MYCDKGQRMAGYSIDLRERVIRAWQSGKTQTWIAATYDLSLSTVKRYLNRYRATGSVAPLAQSREKPLIGDEDRAAVEAMVAHTPEGTLADYCVLWEQQTGMRVSPTTMSRVLRRFELSPRRDRRAPAAD